MSDSQEKREISYFIDEAGDTTLFNKRGKKLLVGNGASKFFILGKILVADPNSLRSDLRSLRVELMADPYFRDFPSMQPDGRKTAILFHAKDDRPEVRREVFKLLLKHDIKFYAVVRNKTDLANFVLQKNKHDPKYRFKERELYETLTRELFGRLRQSADVISLLFASRGNITRNEALRESLKRAEDFFEAKFGFRRNHVLNVEAKGYARMNAYKHATISCGPCNDILNVMNLDLSKCFGTTSAKWSTWMLNTTESEDWSTDRSDRSWMLAHKKSRWI